MSKDNTRYSLATDGIPDLEDLWEDAIERYGTITKGEKTNHHKSPQKGENRMDKIKDKKLHILIAVYAFFIIAELFFYVPYHNIQMFVSRENVPHTEIIGSGYTTMDNITIDKAYVKKTFDSDTGKIVNTSQLFLNVTITTVLAISVYFLLRKSDEVNEMPMIDTMALAFATEDEEQQILRDYAKEMAKYVKQRRI